jgi:hypothetical protein
MVAVNKLFPVTKKPLRDTITEEALSASSLIFPSSDFLVGGRMEHLHHAAL